MLRLFLLVFVTFISFSWFLVGKSVADGGCKASFINPFTEIRWEGIFPIQIGGVPIKVHLSDPASEGLETDPDKVSSIICVCRDGFKYRIGIGVSYWEPARLIDITKIPYCFPALGIKMNIGKAGINVKHVSGKHDHVGGSTGSSGNSHYLFFNVFDIIDLFVDIPCTRHEGFDIAYISEIDPLWNNDILGSVLNPEAVLFANQIAQAACMADASMAALGYPMNQLFWCMGAWGSTYPLAGNTDISSSVQNSALLLARTIFREARLGLLWDPAVDVCYAALTPVLIKSNYKVHMVRPVVGPIVPLGRPTIMWEHNKNPTFGTSKGSPDNFSYMMFRRVKCCLGFSPGG